MNKTTANSTGSNGSTTSLQTTCEETIQKGSKSFSAASQLFDRDTRRSVHALYAWCRYCDDQIDGQSLGYESVEMTDTPRARLTQLREQTDRALARKPSDHPAFQALAAVMREHDIPHQYPHDLLEGFAIDVEGRPCVVLDDTLRYSYHVAGAVGVMMARIMGVSDEPTLDRACDLGIAMQLSNIVRDVLDDAREGRVYLPLDWLDEEGVITTEIAEPEHRDGLCRVVARLIGEAERYYDSARAGIPHLPLRSAWAIASARFVYRDIGRLVHREGANAWDRRVSTGSSRKIARLLQGGIATLWWKAPGIHRSLTASSSREGLWTRPRTTSPTSPTSPTS